MEDKNIKMKRIFFGVFIIAIFLILSQVVIGEGTTCTVQNNGEIEYNVQLCGQEAPNGKPYTCNTETGLCEFDCLDTSILYWEEVKSQYVPYLKPIDSCGSLGYLPAVITPVCDKTTGKWTKIDIKETCDSNAWQCGNGFDKVKRAKGCQEIRDYGGSSPGPENPGIVIGVKCDNSIETKVIPGGGDEVCVEVDEYGLIIDLTDERYGGNPNDPNKRSAIAVLSCDSDNPSDKNSDLIKLKLTTCSDEPYCRADDYGVESCSTYRDKNNKQKAKCETSSGKCVDKKCGSFLGNILGAGGHAGLVLGAPAYNGLIEYGCDDAGKTCVVKKTTKCDGSERRCNSGKTEVQQQKCKTIDGDKDECIWEKEYGCDTQNKCLVEQGKEGAKIIKEVCKEFSAGTAWCVNEKVIDCLDADYPNKDCKQPACADSTTCGFANFDIPRCFSSKNPDDSNYFIGTCKDGKCEDSCKPLCTGRKCGADFCGGNCGVCQTGETCVSKGWGRTECEFKCSDSSMKCCIVKGSPICKSSCGWFGKTC